MVLDWVSSSFICFISSFSAILHFSVAHFYFIIIIIITASHFLVSFCCIRLETKINIAYRKLSYISSRLCLFLLLYFHIYHLIVILYMISI